MVQQGFITQLFYHFPIFILIFILTFLLLQPPIDAMQSTVIFTHQAENFLLSDKKKGNPLSHMDYLQKQCSLMSVMEELMVVQNMELF